MSLILFLLIHNGVASPIHSGHALFEFGSKRGKLTLHIRVDMADLNEAVVLKGGCGIFQTKTVCADRYIQDRMLCLINGAQIKLKLEKFKKKDQHALLFYETEVVTKEVEEFAITLNCFLDVNPSFVNTVAVDLEGIKERKPLSKDESSLRLIKSE